MPRLGAGQRGRHSESGVYIAMIEKTTPCAVEASKPQQGDSGKTLILFSDDLDKVLATFVLANGAAATGRKVSIFKHFITSASETFLQYW